LFWSYQSLDDANYDNRYNDVAHIILDELYENYIKESEIEIKAVNKDINSLKISDLIINNSNTILHLFSNILDVELFRLDREFLEKISHLLKKG
jgi:hypothetical protein